MLAAHRHGHRPALPGAVVGQAVAPAAQHSAQGQALDGMRHHDRQGGWSLQTKWDTRGDGASHPCHD